MNLLVLGGSVFVGRHVVEAALAAGHAVTVFNRGQRPLPWPDRVTALRGDRDGDVSALRGVNADAVIDCCGYTPAQVDASARALQHVPFHVFVSTISVHAAFPPGQAWNEDLPLTAEAQGYGGAKARAEEALSRALPGRVAIVRPGLVVGPWDPTGRFTWWPQRVARGGDVVAPGRPQRPVQFIDVRDLGAFCVRLAEQRHGGVFTGVGAAGTMQHLLETCRDVAGSDARFHWCADDVLLQHGVAPWTGVPLWIPEQDPTHGGLLLGRDTRAVGAGLKTRDWLDTVADTLSWARAEAVVSPPGIGLDGEQERTLLQSMENTADGRP
jgi:2'-hydroxyisoflavone reductase